ncbi:transmembrane protein PVRIG isoform X2 [Manis pentadactyla]|uniref:transmembrane protein PVRIG isoform X2 n=1 Tax=Manis pentadactyla TaxID=143292 RepID=UPI00255D0330|nr:transmembrane protein PVRIG isoform X2 [Manis pentadactyla]KAI5128137.1 Transmembrane Protein Pvrig [Manis pentadactyla]
MRTETQVLSPPRQPLEPGPEGTMNRPWALGLLWVLLMLCITAGTPEVWVQVHMEATKSPSLTVRCGFLGSGSISLVTVSSGGRDGAGGTRLAVLHPKFGTQQWPPALQAHWETRSSISLSLEGDPNRGSPSPNTTFCCKFASFPEGSQEACGCHGLNTDQGLPTPTAAPILRADLAGILGVSGFLLLGCVYLLHLLHRQRHWSVMKLQPLLTIPQTPGQARVRIGCVWSERNWLGLRGPSGAASLGLPSLSLYRVPAKLPGPLSTSPMYPATLTLAPQLWARPSRPSLRLSGSCSLAPRCRPACPCCRPLCAAASSTWRMDSMLRQERGLLTLAPILLLPMTICSPEPERNQQDFDKRDTQAPLAFLCAQASSTPPVRGLLPGHLQSLHNLFNS